MVDRIQRSRVDEEVIGDGIIPGHLDCGPNETPPSANRERHDVALVRSAELRRAFDRDLLLPVVDGDNAPAKHVVADDAITPWVGRRVIPGNTGDSQINVLDLDIRQG